LRAIIAMLKRIREPYWRFKLEEFKRLCKAAGYMIVGEVLQTKPSPLSATLFGRGKIEEIKRLAEDLDAEVVLVYNNLKSIQKINLERITKKIIRDRYDVTLEIFAKNAMDAVSKLQIELAQIQREIPYIKLIASMLHVKDHPFIRAGGEYAWVAKVTELRKRMKKIRREIERYLEDKIRQILERKEKGFKLICLVGYYNAGKTTLFNVLTGENKPVSDMPFTTLSSKYSKLIGTKEVLLIDTIGFIVDLDPRIIKSFELNVEDMKYSDCLLLVIDASDPQNWFKLKLETAISMLMKISALGRHKPVIIVLNKIDQIENPIDLESKKIIAKEVVEQLRNVNTRIIEISAKNQIGIDKLVKIIEEMLS